jgi:hypothetical protein
VTEFEIDYDHDDDGELTSITRKGAERSPAADADSLLRVETTFACFGVTYSSFSAS